MRIGTFLIGAAVGAAASMYFNSNRSMKAMMSGMRNMDSGWMMDKAAKMAGKTMDNMMHASSSKNAASKSTSKPKADLHKVKEIVDNEAHLKYQVNEILKENEHEAHH